MSKNISNDVINSIMPFDIENCVKFNSNYLRGYTSEKRDMNMDNLKYIVDMQIKDIARHSVNDSLKYYDRGVKWINQELNIKGQQWKSAYLPVWLYTYQEVKGDEKIVHYIAVNARTQETKGSIPINKSKLVLVSIFVELLAILFMLFMRLEGIEGLEIFSIFSGFIYFFAMKKRCMNKIGIHHHEKETKIKIDKLIKKDLFLRRVEGLKNKRILGANNTSIHGFKMTRRIFKKVSRDKINDEQK